jgi:hypothetical protein
LLHKYIMTGSELRAEQNIASDSSSCAYSDGPKYVGCQVAARGWPEPQNMSGGRGRRSKTARKSRRAKKCGKCGKKRCGHKQSRPRGKARSRSRSKGRGGFIGQAIVPFSLLVAQKKIQSRRNKNHSRSRKHKSYRKRR